MGSFNSFIKSLKSPWFWVSILTVSLILIISILAYQLTFSKKVGKCYDSLVYLSFMLDDYVSSPDDCDTLMEHRKIFRNSAFSKKFHQFFIMIWIGLLIFLIIQAFHQP